MKSVARQRCWWISQLLPATAMVVVVVVAGFAAGIEVSSSSENGEEPQHQQQQQQLRDGRLIAAGSESAWAPQPTASSRPSSETRLVVDCRSLQPGQYICNRLPIVDPETQQPRGCLKGKGLAPDALECLTAPGLICEATGNRTFFVDAPCNWTNGYDFETALFLSIFLGMFGVDRFYLGYPAVGLLKFCTLGFFFLGHLLDVILIASQTLGPADGSHYVIDYFGPGIEVIRINNGTVRKPQPDWF